jgi:hypothetical protein
MKSIRDWIHDCKEYISTGERIGLWPWRDKLVEWLQESRNDELAKIVKVIHLGPFMDDTDLDYIHKVQEDGLRKIAELLEVRYVAPPNRIFLSHKGTDKPLVREFFQTLQLIGLNPWLDEDAMTAGVPLERSLLKGIKESCAAIFFITSRFQDDKFLATELDYAIAEKREKGEGFTIITLLFRDPEGKIGAIPELLRRYVWKEPKTELEALRDILRALPLKVYMETKV